MRLKCKYITMSGKCQKHSTPEVNEYCLGSPCEDYEGYGTKEVVPRYIDADALADNIAVLFERNQALIDEWLMYHVEDAIDEAPTIEAEPVRHGQWNIYHNDNIPFAFKCSACGQLTIEATKCCPNCGAKMDEVNE